MVCMVPCVTCSAAMGRAPHHPAPCCMPHLSALACMLHPLAGGQQRLRVHRTIPCSREASRSQPTRQAAQARTGRHTARAPLPSSPSPSPVPTPTPTPTLTPYPNPTAVSTGGKLRRQPQRRTRPRGPGAAKQLLPAACHQTCVQPGGQLSAAAAARGAGMHTLGGGASARFSPISPLSTARHAGQGLSDTRPSLLLRSPSASLCASSPHEEAAARERLGAHRGLLCLLAEQHLVIRAYKHAVQQLEAASAPGPAAGGRAGNLAERDSEPSLRPGGSRTAGAEEAAMRDSGMGKCCCSGTSPACQPCGGYGAHLAGKSRQELLLGPAAPVQSDDLHAGATPARGPPGRPASPQLCSESLRRRSAEVERQLAVLLAKEHTPPEPGGEAAALLGQLAGAAQLDGSPAAKLRCRAPGDQPSSNGQQALLELRREHALLQGQHTQLQQEHAALVGRHSAIEAQLAASRERCVQLEQQLGQARQQRQRAGAAESGSQQLGEGPRDQCRQPELAEGGPRQLGGMRRQQHCPSELQCSSRLRRDSGGSDLVLDGELSAQELQGRPGHASERLCSPSASDSPGRRRLYSCPGWQGREEAGGKSRPKARLNPVTTDEVLLRAQATRALHAEVFAEEDQMVAEATQQVELLRQLVEELRAESNGTKRQLRECQEQLELAHRVAAAGEESGAAATAAAEAEVAGLRQRVAEASAALARPEDERLLLLARVAGLQGELAAGAAAAAAAQCEAQQQLESQRQEFEHKVESQRQEFESKVESQQQAFEQKVESQRQEFEHKLESQQQAFEQKVESQRQVFEHKLESQRQEFEFKAKSQRQELEHKVERQRQELEGKAAAMTEQVVKERQQLQARLRLSVMIGHGKQRGGA